MWKNAYIWDDLEITSLELRKDYGTLQAQYSVSPEQTIVAGHSMGGEIAVWSSLSGQLPVRGFVAIAPSGPFMDELESWKTIIEQSQDRELRGYFIVGENDRQTSLSNLQALADWLIEAGIPCEVESLPGMDNKYSPSYGAALLRALEYIMGEG
jgi:predicted esterase